MREEFFAQLDKKAKEYRPMVLHSHEDAQAICEAANKELSELAVKLHNAGLTHGEGPELELVEPLDSNLFMFNTFHYRMNFIAKPKDGSDDEKKCYFAEVKGTHGGDKLLTICCPVEAKGSSRSEINQGCLACRVHLKIFHALAGNFTRCHGQANL